ncbi:MAG: hypothetical protein GWO23_02205 [Gammaproteobacteria bacterium]|nr:hypothetical protein [Gammaproteobacteria bacterium]NIS49637.1 hypothetical protein [Phycisphaerae bacterium]
MIRAIRLYGTTDASGDLTVTAEVKSWGLLHAVEWIDGTFADGVDAVISFTSSNSAVSRTVLTLTDANDDAWYFPREALHDNAGAGVTYDGTNEIYDRAVVDGILKMVVSSGGNAKAGGCVVYLVT